MLSHSRSPEPADCAGLGILGIIPALTGFAISGPEPMAVVGIQARCGAFVDPPDFQGHLEHERASLGLRLAHARSSCPTARHPAMAKRCDTDLGASLAAWVTASNPACQSPASSHALVRPPGAAVRMW
jgi:hypothetical protein